jgi:hypothetical protein
MRCASLSLFALLVMASAALAGPTYTDPEKADDDFAFQGEYLGEVGDENDPQKVGVQVIALGKGKFRAVAYVGGLPGEGWDASKDRHEVEGERKGDEVVFAQDDGRGVIKDGKLKITIGGNDVGTIDKVQRKSPTLGKEPPEGAIVLFDGSSADAFEGGKLDGDLLVQGATSKQKFGDHSVHVEFRTPYQPEDSTQGRGNSGVYLQGRYEVQILDSFGLKGEQNECGGIYTVAAPKVNMCLPPLAWQTYDIDFTAAKYEGDKLVENPRITVKHNGIVIHDNRELPGDRNTTAAPVAAGKEPGPLYLQDHGNPVRFRNIWVVEKK